jgi:hypothetical protein
VHVRAGDGVHDRAADRPAVLVDGLPLRDRAQRDLVAAGNRADYFDGAAIHDDEFARRQVAQRHRHVIRRRYPVHGRQRIGPDGKSCCIHILVRPSWHRSRPRETGVSEPGTST